MEISVMVEDIDKEREIIVTDYTFWPGFPAETRRAPEDCFPGEPDIFEDVVCHWLDTKEQLTGEEYELHQEEIEAALITDREENHG